MASKTPAITGVILGLTIDSVVLHLEESLSRDAHRQALLNALNDVRADFMRNLEPAQAGASPEASAP